MILAKIGKTVKGSNSPGELSGEWQPILFQPESRKAVDWRLGASGDSLNVLPAWCSGLRKSAEKRRSCVSSRVCVCV